MTAVEDKPVRGTKVPPDVQARMVESYGHGDTLQNISDEIGCAKGTITRVLLLHGVTLRAQGGNRGQRLTHEQLREVAELYQDGYSYREIGVKLGLSTSAVRHRVSVAGANSKSREARSHDRHVRGIVREGSWGSKRSEVVAITRELGRVSAPDIADRQNRPRASVSNDLRMLALMGVLKVVGSEGRRVIYGPAE